MEVYLDLENATPLPEPVLKAMLPYFGERAFGHSALTHRVGWEAYAAVEESLGRLALALGVPPEDLALTHDAVEAANLACEGLILGRPAKRKTVVVSAIVPLNVMYAAEKLEQHGFTIVKVPVDAVAWANSGGHIVLTHDLDFGAILAATNADGSSVVQLRFQDLAPSHAAQPVVKVLQDYKRELEQGALISLDEDRARVRILPL